jgi:hypothetical protein
MIVLELLLNETNEVKVRETRVLFAYSLFMAKTET